MPAAKCDLGLFIERLLLRSVLSTSERSAIAGLPTEEAKIAANRDMVRPGDDDDHLTCIVSGLAASFVQDRQGKRQFTGLHIEGDMPDLHSVVLPSASIGLQALSDVRILRVERHELEEVAARHPAIFEALWRDTLVDLGILAHWTLNIGRRSASERIAHLLCEMACRYGCAPSDKAIEFMLPMTQVHLASATGLSTVHANRSVAALKLDGISLAYGEVKITSWERLTKIAHFDPAYLRRPAVHLNYGDPGFMVRPSSEPWPTASENSRIPEGRRAG